MSFFDSLKAGWDYGINPLSDQASLLGQQDAAFSSVDLTAASKSFGTGAAIFGAVQGAIGSFYSAKMQANNLKFQSQMAALNARAAESQAQSILAAGEREVGQVTMRAGKIKSAQKAAMAANGIDIGVGSAAEVQATTDLTKELEALTIDSNATRAAAAARVGAVNATGQSLMAGAASRSISAFSAGASSLITGASTVANQWFRDKRADQLASLLGT